MNSSIVNYGPSPSSRSSIRPTAKNSRYSATLAMLAFWSCVCATGISACNEPNSDTTNADTTNADTTNAADAGDTQKAEITQAGANNVLIAVDGPTNIAVANAGWYRGDLHYHTDYSGDAKKQGGDDLATCLAIADAWRDPTWLKRFPEYAGNGLDFVAITDHRTTAAKDDVNFKHDHLIVILGAEYGGNGHAGTWGIKDYVTHEPAKGQSATARHQLAIDEVHAQGGLFSPNHPTQRNMWHWDVDNYDAVEVWNAPWSAFWPEESPQLLDELTAQTKRENPWIRHALGVRGGGTNHQALWFWYGHLASGAHPAAVGGSDRHMLVPAALPTTYVFKPKGSKWAGKSGKKLGSDGIIEGIRQGGTFVSRSPLGAQIVLTAETMAAGAKTETFTMGAALPVAQRYRLRFTVTRAKGGILRIVGGPRVKADSKGRFQAKASVLFEAPIHGQRAEGGFTWTVPAEGGWVHALVLEPRVVGTLPASMKVVDEITSTLPKTKAVGAIVKTMMSLIDDTSVLFSASLCQTADWKADKALCMPVDKMTWSTFYLPEAAVRLLNTWFVDGKPTQWSMAALTSAFVVEPK